jgi:Ca-activated chloride channel family protein
LSVNSLFKRVRPRHARGAIVAVALAAASVGFLLAPSAPPPHVLEIDYVISPDAETLLTPLVSDFNRQRIESNGQVIRVTVVPTPSGKAATDMGNSLRPVMWTPASSAWPEFVSDAWWRTSVRSLFESPELVAVWKTEADRLGLANTIGFADLAHLVAAHELHFGHTDPGSSTSGLFAVLSEFSFFAEKAPADLTVDDVSLPLVRENVRNFEGATAHYVDIARDFADEWCQYGVGFASAAYMQETTLIGFNQSCRTQLRAVYVTDFPFVADYPLVTLTGPWVDDAEAEAARVFGGWLDKRLAEDPKVGASGFRRGKTVPDEGSGADPAQPTEEPPSLPNVGLLRQVQRAWSELRRPANVMLVADESQHMAVQGKEELLKEALFRFLACPGSGEEAGDRVGMITSGGEGPDLVRARVPLEDFDTSRVPLGQEIESLAARGGSALWDAVDRAIETPELADRSPIDTIVVLAEGSDDGSSVNPDALEAKLRDSVARGRPIQVLVVPYGSNPRAQALLKEHLVTPSLGRYYKGEVTDLADVKKFICAVE